MRKNNLCEGDWNSTTLNGVQENRTHNDVHEMLTRGGNTLTTDAKGNITVNSNGQRYTWDADNMMSAADISGDLTNDVTYVYDAGNRRIAKIANGITTVFAYAGWRCVEEYDATSTPVALRKFAFGAYLDEPLMMASVSGANETLHFYHQNANFNVIALTDASGTIADRIAYSSYGQIVMVTNGATGNPWFYTGQRHDVDTGLDYYKMRYYDSNLGRFLSRDPIGYPDGWDLYRYSGSSPIQVRDVYGLDTVSSEEYTDILVVLGRNKIHFNLVLITMVARYLRSDPETDWCWDCISNMDKIFKTVYDVIKQTDENNNRGTYHGKPWWNNLFYQSEKAGISRALNDDASEISHFAGGWTFGKFAQRWHESQGNVRFRKDGASTGASMGMLAVTSNPFDLIELDVDYTYLDTWRDTAAAYLGDEIKSIVHESEKKCRCIAKKIVDGHVKFRDLFYAGGTAKEYVESIDKGEQSENGVHKWVASRVAYFKDKIKDCDD